MGHNLSLILLATSSLGWLQPPVPAAPAGPASLWEGVCPFSTSFMELLLGQEVLRSPKLSCCVGWKGREVLAVTGCLVAQNLAEVDGCVCTLHGVICHWEHTSPCCLLVDVLLFIRFWLESRNYHGWKKPLRTPNSTFDQAPTHQLNTKCYMSNFSSNSREMIPPPPWAAHHNS